VYAIDAILNVYIVSVYESLSNVNPIYI